jgi:hypothetical protein
MELDLVPDGHGGYDGVVRGAFRADDVYDAAHAGVTQLLSSDPQNHRLFWYFADGNHDGTISRFEMEQETMGAMLAPDIRVPGERELVMSAGFAVHLSACSEAGCPVPTLTDRCVDRLRDADETDVDCGGSCGGCPGAGSCQVADDCLSGVCDGGTCRGPSCTNGILDGFEASIDCGGGCAGCGSSIPCDFDVDCASGICAMDPWEGNQQLCTAP